MRRTIFTAAAAMGILIPSGLAVASTDTTTPPDTSGGSTETTLDASETTIIESTTSAAATVTTESGTATTVAEGAATPVAIFDDDDNQVATVMVDDVELEWTEYGDDDAPDEGNQYVRVTVTVASEASDGTFDVSADQFFLQDLHGSLDEGEVKASADQTANSEDLPDSAEMANGESVELALVFEVDATVGPRAVFYRPDDDTLVEITNVS